ncbi:MAG: transposase [Caldilineaceae bacterium]
MDAEHRFNEEFKRNAVQLLLLRAKSVEQIEEQFEIPSGRLLQWVKELGMDVDEIWSKGFDRTARKSSEE